MCISKEESKPCLEEYTTKEKMLVIGGLNASTKYYVRVLASTKVGPGNYSKSKGKFTNGSKCYERSNVMQFHFVYFVILEIFSSSALLVALSSSYLNEFVFFFIYLENPPKSTNQTKSTLSFTLQIPLRNFT